MIAVACSGDEAPAPTEHTHGATSGESTMEWDAGPPPEMSIVIDGDASVGWVARPVADGFTLAEQSATVHVPGEGHIHVFIDGQLTAMLYQPTFAVPKLEPGPHEIRMTLSRNDHMDYAVNGEVISAIATLVVPGEVVPADILVDVRFQEGDVTPPPRRVDVAGGSLVEIRVVSDVAEMVHVHGYDLALTLQPEVSKSLRFTADIRGVFEVEFEDAGELIVELKVD
ncbi:MAG: hypothetical protein ACE5E8_01135 [Acidimicrobiia bacterium]